MRVSLALLAFSAACAAPAAGQITTDDPRPDPTQIDTLGMGSLPDPGPGPRAKPSFSPKIYAPLLWSPSTGLGLGYGVEIQNLGWTGSSVLLTGLTSQRTGRYGAYLSSRTPYAPGANAMLGGTFETTGLRRYYGVGPFSSEDHEIAVEKNLAEAEARVGYSSHPSGRHRVQAFGRYQLHLTRSATDRETNAQQNLDAASAANLAFALANDIGAVTAGVEAIWDERNNVNVPRYGFVVQAGASYTEALEGANVSFVRSYAAANYFLPIEWRNSTVAARAVVSSIDGVRGSDAIPFVLLPVFDADYGLGPSTHRYYARDYFLASAELQTPLILSGLLNVDALASATVYNVYDNIFDRFLPIPSMGKNRERSNRYPLQTALGGGIRLSSDFVQGLVLQIQAGIGPEGLAVSTFSTVLDLRAARPVLRGL